MNAAHSGQLSRRAVLRLGLAAAGALTAGCTAGGLALPGRRAPTTTLAVLSTALLPIASRLITTWEAVQPAVRLQIAGSVPSPGYPVTPKTAAGADIFQTVGDGDLLGGLQAYVDLAPRVRLADFDLAQLQPSGVRAFSFANSLLGLPLQVDPLILLTNTPLVNQVGSAHPPGLPWTLDEVEQAVQRARGLPAATAATQSIAGVPWADARLWAGFVAGLGGQFVDQSGRLDLAVPSTIAATQRLITLANAAGWHGNPFSSGPVGYVGSGFTGAAAQTLFAIEPSSVALRGGARLTDPANRFPVLPTDPLIPGWQTQGLSVTTHARDASLALSFILWLYEPGQQQLLMAAGVPPVVMTAALQAAWSAGTPGSPDASVIFDPRRMADSLAQLPADGSDSSTEYNNWLSLPLLQAAQDPAATGTYLLQAQKGAQGAITFTTARNECTFTHTACTPGTGPVSGPRVVPK